MENLSRFLKYFFQPDADKTLIISKEIIVILYHMHKKEKLYSFSDLSRREEFINL